MIKTPARVGHLLIDHEGKNMPPVAVQVMRSLRKKIPRDLEIAMKSAEIVDSALLKMVQSE